MNTKGIWFFCFVLSFSLFCNSQATAQSKKKVVTKKTSSKTVSGPSTNQTEVLSNQAKADSSSAIKTTAAPSFKDPFANDTIRRSTPFPYGDASIERNLNKTRKPLEYEHIREDDAWYRERVWRDIDIREKMNLAFRYKAEDDNGSQRFINILINAIRSDKLSAFDANVDDRFTTPITYAKISELLTGKCKNELVKVWGTDSSGNEVVIGSTMKLVCPEFNPEEIVKYRIKEEWVFDKESSRMHTRILGIAPLKSVTTGGITSEFEVFWVYYPDLRPVLALYEVYNGKNFGAKMSWEELFESRYFSSTIVKSSIDNPYDLYINQYIKDNILRLLESDNIKSKIFNFEQDLWSY
jgi:gliding motility associated protien GldN